MSLKRTSKTRCPECDKGSLETKCADLTGKTHGESFTIQSEALVCPMCGFKTVPTERMGEFALRIADAWREKHGHQRPDSRPAHRSWDEPAAIRDVSGRGRSQHQALGAWPNSR